MRRVASGAPGRGTAVVPIDTRPTSITVGQQARSDVTIGTRVFHAKFGYGTVAALDGNKLEIDFEKAGHKRVLDNFVEVVAD